MALTVASSRPVAALHRVPLHAVSASANDAGPLVVLPLRLFHTDVVRGRRELHHLLGRHLGCYRMELDPVRRCLCVRLSLLQSEVTTCMGLLAQGMADAEFGRIERVPPYAHHHMPEVVAFLSRRGGVADVASTAAACRH